MTTQLKPAADVAAEYGQTIETIEGLRAVASNRAATMKDIVRAGVYRPVFLHGAPSFAPVAEAAALFDNHYPAASTWKTSNYYGRMRDEERLADGKFDGSEPIPVPVPNKGDNKHTIAAFARFAMHEHNRYVYGFNKDVFGTDNIDNKALFYLDSLASQPDEACFFHVHAFNMDSLVREINDKGYVQFLGANVPLRDNPEWVDVPGLPYKANMEPSRLSILTVTSNSCGTTYWTLPSDKADALDELEARLLQTRPKVHFDETPMRVQPFTKTVEGLGGEMVQTPDGVPAFFFGANLHAFTPSPVVFPTRRARLFMGTGLGVPAEDNRL